VYLGQTGVLLTNKTVTVRGSLRFWCRSRKARDSELISGGEVLDRGVLLSLSARDTNRNYMTRVQLDPAFNSIGMFFSVNSMYLGRVHELRAGLPDF
jgi:hypothetical protein